mgnify:FL=1
MKRISLAAAVTVLIVSAGGPASANPCEAYTAYHEKAHGIPAHLLTAIARVESGSWDRQNAVVRAWPWTVTSPEGDVKHPSKWAAIQAVRDLQREGVTNIDVGCMQINLHHHPQAFRTLNEAFDPARNVAYGAKVLREHYRRTEDWRMAVALYHSANPELNRPYQEKVEDLWQQANDEAGQVDWFNATSDDPDFDRPRSWSRFRVSGEFPFNIPHWARRHGDGRWHWRSWRFDPRQWAWFDRVVPSDADADGIALGSAPWRAVGTNRFN